jgi:hypothetical protein
VPVVRDTRREHRVAACPTASGMADDTFLVVGHVDGDELARNLER